MKIKNRSFSATVIPLPGGGSLPLPGRESMEISEEDFNSPEIQRLFTAGIIFVLPETAPRRVAAEKKSEEPEAAPAAPAAPEPERRGRRR
jgi:hypothetical protein